VARFSEFNAKLLILLVFVMVHDPHFDVTSSRVTHHSNTASQIIFTRVIAKKRDLGIDYRRSKGVHMSS